MPAMCFTLTQKTQVKAISFFLLFKIILLKRTVLLWLHAQTPLMRTHQPETLVSSESDVLALALARLLLNTAGNHGSPQARVRPIDSHGFCFF